MASPRISVFTTIDTAEQGESLRICLELLPVGNYNNDATLTTLHHLHFIVFVILGSNVGMLIKIPLF